jgi:hypothetical protein
MQGANAIAERRLCHLPPRGGSTINRDIYPTGVVIEMHIGHFEMRYVHFDKGAGIYIADGFDREPLPWNKTRILRENSPYFDKGGSSRNARSF